MKVFGNCLSTCVTPLFPYPVGKQAETYPLEWAPSKFRLNLITFSSVPFGDMFGKVLERVSVGFREVISIKMRETLKDNLACALPFHASKSMSEQLEALAGSIGFPTLCCEPSSQY